MNQRSKRAEKIAAGPGVCELAGAALTDLLRRLGPPEEARRHFEAARIEILKGLRALLDARIQRREKGSRRGEKIAVE